MINMGGETELEEALFCIPNDRVGPRSGRQWLLKPEVTHQRETHCTWMAEAGNSGTCSPALPLRMEAPAITDLLVGYRGVCPALAGKRSCHKAGPLDLTTVL